MSSTRQPSKKVVYTQQSNSYAAGTHLPVGSSWTAPTVILPKAFDDSCRKWTSTNNPIRDALLGLDAWIAAGKPGYPDTPEAGEIEHILVPGAGQTLVSQLDFLASNAEPQVGDPVTRLDFTHDVVIQLAWAVSELGGTMVGAGSQLANPQNDQSYFFGATFQNTKAPDWGVTYMVRYGAPITLGLGTTMERPFHGILVDDSGTDGTGAVVQTHGVLEGFDFGSLVQTHRGGITAGDPVYVTAYNQGAHVGGTDNPANGHPFYVNSPDWVNTAVAINNTVGYAYMGRCISIDRGTSIGSLYLNFSGEPGLRRLYDAVQSTKYNSGADTYNNPRYANPSSLVIAPTAPFINTTGAEAPSLNHRHVDRSRPTLTISTKYNMGHSDREKYTGFSHVDLTAEGGVGGVVSSGGVDYFVNVGAGGHADNGFVANRYLRLETYGATIDNLAGTALWSPLLALHDGSDHELSKQVMDSAYVGTHICPFANSTYIADTYPHEKAHLLNPTVIASANLSSLVIGNYGYQQPNGVGILGDLKNVTNESEGHDGSKGRSIRGFRHMQGLQKIESGYWRDIVRDGASSFAESVNYYNTGLEVHSRVSDSDITDHYSFKVSHHQVDDNGTLSALGAQDDLVVQPLLGRLDISNLSYDATGGYDPTLYSGSSRLCLQSNNTSNVAFSIQHKSHGEDGFSRWFVYDHTTNTVRIAGDLAVTGDLQITGDLQASDQVEGDLELNGDLVLQYPHKIKAVAKYSNPNNATIIELADPDIANQTARIRAGMSANYENCVEVEGARFKVDSRGDSYGSGALLQLQVSKTQVQIDNNLQGGSGRYYMRAGHSNVSDYADTEFNGTDFEITATNTLSDGGNSVNGVTTVMTNKHFGTHSHLAEADRKDPKHIGTEIHSYNSLVFSAGVTDGSDHVPDQRSYIAFHFERIDNDENNTTAMLLDRTTGCTIHKNLNVGGVVSVRTGNSYGIQWSDPVNSITESSGHLKIKAQKDIINQLSMAAGDHTFRIQDGAGEDFFTVDTDGKIMFGDARTYLDHNSGSPILASAKDFIVHLDENQASAASDGKFIVKNGAGEEKFTVNENGDIAGSAISALDGASFIQHLTVLGSFISGGGQLFAGGVNDLNAIFHNDVQMSGDLNVTGTLTHLTGGHSSTFAEEPSEDLDLEGLIVCSSGEYIKQPCGSDITLRNAWSKVVLSTERNMKTAYGVYGGKNSPNDADTREGLPEISPYDFTVNSLGEGGIWVCNVNGNLENGDYITTCEAPGLGMKQDDDLLHNYTVAKITMDCDFDLESTVYRCEEFKIGRKKYRKAFVGCTYHCG